jgi:hypothetical protein
VAEELVKCLHVENLPIKCEDMSLKAQSQQEREREREREREKRSRIKNVSP